MKRKIIKINEEKCNGCGLCAKACHEGAIGMIGGKAKLLRDDYCDGLGDCLPVCPADAISFEEREAAAYDEAAVKANMAQNAKGQTHVHDSGAPNTEAQAHGDCECHHGHPHEDNHGHGKCEKQHEHVHGHSGGCMSTAFNGAISKNTSSGCGGHNAPAGKENAECGGHNAPADSADIPSALTHWPVQIKLAPIHAPYFDDGDLLIAADCCAYAYGNFHGKFMDGKITLIGCPKLDMINYAEKLTEIIKSNHIKSITVARMEVPCCGGMEHAVKQAVASSGKDIAPEIITIGIDGSLKE